MRRLVNQRPTRGGMLVLSMMPFVLLIAAYLAASGARLAANPGISFCRRPRHSPALFTATPSKRTSAPAISCYGSTRRQLKRLIIALGVSAFLGVTLGWPSA